MAGAYGQTDVMNDPAYLRALMSRSNPHDPLRRMAEVQYERIQQEAQMRQNAQQHAAGLAAHQRGIDEGVHDRQERARQAHLDKMFTAQQNAEYRKTVEAQRSAQQQSIDDERMLNLLPDIRSMGPQGPAIAQKVLNDYLAKHGVNVNVAPQAKPGDKSLAAFGQQQGKTPAQGQQPATQGQQPQPQQQPQQQQQQPQQQGATGYTTGGAQFPVGGAQQPAPATNIINPSSFAEPTQPPQMTGYHWTAGHGGVSGGNDAGMQVFYDDGSSRFVNTSVPGQFPQERPPVQRNVEGGNVVGPLAQQIPAGYDLNFNTGRLVPQSNQGTINGIPTNQALVEGAARSGVRPIHSAGAMTALDQIGRETQAASVGAGQPTLESDVMGRTPQSPRFEGQSGGGQEGGKVIQEFSPANLANQPVQQPSTQQPPAQPPGTPATGGTPQRELVPADYIAHYLGKAFGAFHNYMSEESARHAQPPPVDVPFFQQPQQPQPQQVQQPPPPVKKPEET